MSSKKENKHTKYRRRRKVGSRIRKGRKKRKLLKKRNKS